MAVDEATPVFSIHVPSDAKPGETKLSLATGDGHSVRFTVPPEALAGDLLVLRQSEDSVWKCTISRDHAKHGTMPKPQSRKRITFLLPADIEPGETKLDVGSGLDKVRIDVPAHCRPGDKMEISNEADGVQWRASVIKENCVQDKPQLSMEKVAELDSLKAPPLESVRAFEELVEAARAAGGFVSPKLVRGSKPPLNVPGLLTNAPIEKGEELCRIPERQHISSRTATKYLPELVKAVNEHSDIHEERRLEVAQATLMALLLQDAEDRADARQKGESPPDRLPILANVEPDVIRVWDSYADSLLSEDFAYHPYRKAALDPEAIRAEYEPSHEAEFLINMAEDLIEVHRTVCDVAPQVLGTEVEVGMYIRARLCMLTRVFLTWCESTLVPVIDLMNHAAGVMPPGVVWRWDESAQAMIATAERDHIVGEELFDSYGPRSNLLFSRTYGFTQMPSVEPSWSYVVRPMQAYSVFETFLPKDNIAVQIILDTRRLEESLTKALNAAGYNAREFLHLICARCIIPYQTDVKLRPALEGLRRARAKDARNCKWWAELSEADEAIIEEDSMRIKMSEYLCLTTYLEAIRRYNGHLDEQACLAEGSQLRCTLIEALRILDQKGHFAIQSVSVPVTA